RKSGTLQRAHETYRSLRASHCEFGVHAPYFFVDDPSSGTRPAPERHSLRLLLPSLADLCRQLYYQSLQNGIQEHKMKKSDTNQKSLRLEALDVYENWPSELVLEFVVLVVGVILAMVLNTQFEVSPLKAVLYTSPVVVLLMLLLPLAYAAYSRSSGSKGKSRSE